MTTRALLAAAALLLLAALPAAAEKIMVAITPRSAADHGFAVRTGTRPNGTVEFTITRDLSKAHWPGRTGYLRVRGGGRLLVECKVAAERRGNQLTYWFSLAPTQVADAEFSLWEVQTASGEPDGEELLGGGTIYEFHPADFTNPSTR